MRTAFCVTPPGRSALGTIRVTGLQSPSELNPFFRPAGRHQNLADYPPRRIVFGTWLNLAGSSEELVVTRLSDVELEIHCHGGAAAINAILDTLASIGCEVRRINRVGDLPLGDWWSELEAALVQATTRKVADRLLAMQQETFRRELTQWRELIDSAPQQAIDRLRTLSHSLDRGQYLARPVRVVLAGPPNVGKSTINNQILGFERSIIFDQPGTTRDVVSARTTIDGWVFEFSDTAGLRDSDDAIEGAGIRLARRVIERADLVVWVQSAEKDAGSLVDWLRECQTEMGGDGRRWATLTVVNKLDQLDAGQREEFRERLPGVLLTNARTGEGIEELMTRMKQQVIDPEPEAGEVVLFTLRQKQIVEQAIASLEAGDRDAAQAGLRKLESGE